jgi:hypothetical protein
VIKAKSFICINRNPDKRVLAGMGVILAFKKVSFLKFKFEIWHEKIATEQNMSEENFD